MAEDEPDDSDAGTRRRNLKSVANLVRATERLARMRNRADEAHAWAEATPGKAGRPTVPGLYTLNDDGELVLLKEKARDTRYLAASPPAGRPWSLTLHEALLRLGHHRTSPEYLAALMVDERVRLERALAAGHVDLAIDAAVVIGVLYAQGQDREVAETRAKRRRSILNASREHEVHGQEEKAQWLLLDLRLQREGMEHATERAEAIGKAFSAKPETVRREVRERRKDAATLEKIGGRVGDTCLPQKGELRGRRR